MRKWWPALILWLCLSIYPALAQDGAPQGVTILVNRDGVNVRLYPEIGAEVIGFVNAGWRAPATGRSPDNEWIRISFNGEEAWIGFPVINLFGDINALPVRDPRTIPYGGFEAPRSGRTSADSPIKGRLADSGLRVRGGPSRAYPVLANAPRYTVFPLLGRTINNAWLQVNFEGTLGWVATRYVEIQDGASIIDLPVDGIVAEALIFSESTDENYQGTLRFMLDRVDLAQPSLDTIRGVWTNIALGGVSACGGYPPRPSDLNIPNPLLAAFYPTLDPLLKLFNEAMGNVRLAIDLWIETCSRPQPQRGDVGLATVQGALNVVNIADGQFAELRRRLNELLPPPLELGPDQCLFTFQGASQVLPVIGLSQIVRGNLVPGERTVGYCLDVAAGQTLRFELLQVSGNAQALLVVSPLDNPTAFTVTGRATDGQTTLNVSPVQIVQTGRYLVIISDTDDARPEPLASDFALLVTDITGVSPVGPTLILDPNTGQPIIGDPATTFVPTQEFTVPGTGEVICPNPAFTCEQLSSCEEAIACQELNFALPDANGDGRPCDNLCLP